VSGLRATRRNDRDWRRAGTTQAAPLRASAVAVRKPVGAMRCDAAILRIRFFVAASPVLKRVVEVAVVVPLFTFALAYSSG
jgi:hypothetical protein